MPFTEKERTAVTNFFRDHDRRLKQRAQGFADQKHRRQTLSQFIWDLDDYIEKLPDSMSLIKGILTHRNMQANLDLIQYYYDKIMTSVTVLASPPPPPPSPCVEEWLRSAVFVEALDGRQIPDAEADAAQKLDIPPQDAAKAVTTHDMSRSLLNGIYLHKTKHSSSSDYGVRDTDGIYKITYFYARGGMGLYLVGYGAHRDSGEKTEYQVQKSLTTRLHKGDVLRFH